MQQQIKQRSKNLALLCMHGNFTHVLQGFCNIKTLRYK